MNYELYILKLNNDQFYIGSTNNLVRRLAEHSSGKTVSIRHKLPCKVVFRQEFSSCLLARRAEIFVKKQKSRKFIEKMIVGVIDFSVFLGEGP